MTSEKSEIRIFNFNDISKEEWEGLIDSIPEKYLVSLFKNVPAKQQIHFEGIRGFRFDKVPIPKIKTSLLKGIKRNDDVVLGHIRIMLTIYVKGLELENWITKLDEDKDIESFYDTVKAEIIAESLPVQPLTWVKLVLVDHSQIPLDYCLIIELPKKDKPAATEVKEPKVTKDVKSSTESKYKKLLEKSNEKYEKLKEEFSNSKEKHKQEIEELKNNQDIIYSKFIQSIKGKIVRIHSVSLDAELIKIVNDHKVDTFEKLWAVLNSIESELFKSSDKEESIKSLEKLMVIKYTLLAGKETI